MKTTLQKGIIIYWAIALFYLHLGSLVNFHQHHLWKKYLIPTVVAVKKEKQESAVVVKVKYHQGNGGFNSNPIANQILESYNLELTGFVTLDLFTGDCSAFCTNFRQAGTLRGPPQA